MGRLANSIILLTFTAPILLLFSTLFFGQSTHFDYFLKQSLIKDYFTNSILVTIITALITSLIAIPSAYWISFYDFKGKKTLEWMLVLPLAVPSYIAAMVYSALLESAGPVQYFIRDIFQLQYGEYWFPQIQSIGGMSLVLAFTLYPYLYLLLRAAFMALSSQIIESAILLGAQGNLLFFRLIFPACRPAFIAGLSLVIMETLADFGVASLFGIPVFTTGIYRAWNSFYDPIAAGRIALILLIFIFTMIWIEKLSRGHRKYSNLNITSYLKPRKLNAIVSIYMYIHFFLAILLGFLIPLTALGLWSIPNINQFIRLDTLELTSTTLIISTLTSLLVITIGLFTAYAIRSSSNIYIKVCVALSNCGYAVPGIVIAVSVLLVLINIQNLFFDGALILTGTILGIVWGCTLRFTTIGFNTLSAGLDQITNQMDEVVSLLGYNSFYRLFRLHIPLLRNSLLVSFILVFIETLKELPATLLLRPFDVNTLAIKVYEYASDEMVELAAPMGFLMIVISIFPTIIFNTKLKFGASNARSQ